MEILGKILGSPARVKIMRLFLSDKAKSFENKEIVKRSRVNASAVRKELNLLSSTGFIKKKKQAWSFDPSFSYANEIENLLLGIEMVDKDYLIETFKKSGKVKLLIVAGTFIKKDSRVDILIVGDKLNRRKIEDGLKKIESEIGKELTYAIFDSTEFLYRLNMYDKLIRDILDFPHEVIIETKELSTQALKKS